MQGRNCNQVYPLILTRLLKHDMYLQYNYLPSYHFKSSISGILTKSGHLDREENATLTLRISATDNGVPPLNCTKDVHVTILDFNDNSPQFINFTTETIVPENVSSGYVVLTVDASDADEGPNANVTYKIDSGDEGKFAIDLTSVG